MKRLRPLACLVLVLVAPLAQADERTKRIAAAELKLHAHLAKCAWADARKACGRLARAAIVLTWAEDPKLGPLITPQRMDTLFRRLTPPTPEPPKEPKQWKSEIRCDPPNPPEEPAQAKPETAEARRARASGLRRCRTLRENEVEKFALWKEGTTARDEHWEEICSRWEREETRERERQAERRAEEAEELDWLICQHRKDAAPTPDEYREAVRKHREDVEGWIAKHWPVDADSALESYARTLEAGSLAGVEQALKVIKPLTDAAVALAWERGRMVLEGQKR